MGLKEKVMDWSQMRLVWDIAEDAMADVQDLRPSKKRVLRIGISTLSNLSLHGLIHVLEKSTHPLAKLIAAQLKDPDKRQDLRRGLASALIDGTTLENVLMSATEWSIVAALTAAGCPPMVAGPVKGVAMALIMPVVADVAGALDPALKAFAAEASTRCQAALTSALDALAAVPGFRPHKSWTLYGAHEVLSITLQCGALGVTVLTLPATAPALVAGGCAVGAAVGTRLVVGCVWQWMDYK